MQRAMAFIERLGRDAGLAGADAQTLGAAARAAELPEELVQALASRDRGALEALLGARTNLVCAVFPVQPDEGEGEPVPEQEPAKEPEQQRLVQARAA